MVKQAADKPRRPRLLRAQRRSSRPRTPTPRPTGFFNFATYNTVFMTPNTPTDFRRHRRARPAALRVPGPRPRRRDPPRRRRPRAAPSPAGATASSTGSRRTARSRRTSPTTGSSRRSATGRSRWTRSATRTRSTPTSTSCASTRSSAAGASRSGCGRRSPTTARSTSPRSTIYNADHHGAATRVVEAAIRALGKVPAHQEVVNAYGNTDEGDMSAGLDRRGPACGRRRRPRARPDAMLERLARRGQAHDARRRRSTRAGRASASAARTPRAARRRRQGRRRPAAAHRLRGGPRPALRRHRQGRSRASTAPVDDPTAGPQDPDADPERGLVPKAVPLIAVARRRPLIVASIPGEMTVGMGERVRDAVLAAARRPGVARVVLSGLANEYLPYFIDARGVRPPALRGRLDALRRATARIVLQGTLADLAAPAGARRAGARAVPARPAQRRAAPTRAPFGAGRGERAVARAARAASARLERGDVRRGRAARAATTARSTARSSRVQRRDRRQGGLADRRRRPRPADRSGGSTTAGRYDAHWEVPLSTRAGVYRFVVTAQPLLADVAAVPRRPVARADGARDARARRARRRPARLSRAP